MDIWTSNSKWDIWTRADLDPAHQDRDPRTGNQGPGDPGTGLEPGTRASGLVEMPTLGPGRGGYQGWGCLCSKLNIENMHGLILRKGRGWSWRKGCTPIEYMIN